EPAKRERRPTRLIRSEIVLVDVPLHPDFVKHVYVGGMQPGSLQGTGPLQFGVTVREASQGMPARIGLLQVRGDEPRRKLVRVIQQMIEPYRSLMRSNRERQEAAIGFKLV